MKRLELAQLIKAGFGFATISAAGLDSCLLFCDRAGVLNVSGDWYINGPLLVWGVVSLPVSIGLAQRLIETAYAKPGRVTLLAEGGQFGRSIPFTANGKTGTILAHTAQVLFGGSVYAQAACQPPPPARRALWRVPVATANGETVVTVRERELLGFLEVCSSRAKYQFSRRYWTERRRPPLDRPRYEAYVTLLTQAGLIEGRHEGGGASGRLAVFPREALSVLKYGNRAYRD